MAAFIKLAFMGAMHFAGGWAIIAPNWFCTGYRVGIVLFGGHYKVDVSTSRESIVTVNMSKTLVYKFC